MLTSTVSVFLSLSLFITSAFSDPGKTTRYWDCCKPSCSWPGKAQVSNPVRTCNKQDLWPNPMDPNAASACGGGEAYSCSNNAPWAVDDNLAYGFAAASIKGSSEPNWCCACYELTFTSTSIAGKRLVVQVTNTGGDLGENHFDLQIPGSGMGLFTDACAKQFPGVWLGEQYGGYSNRDDCNRLPEGNFRNGCFWRFDWFQNANNPTMDFKEVQCPQAMIDRTGCGRWS
ncbi:glycoside hydrolase family 45 protein [Trematosphaeria pertusa]|uniref:Cellulase n=1 Tax=Trematosphaeria pertusa TaxID=390896 RepID=A0A6A6IG57_9PLEO|nr:glycoside hydrolase family 45 protein [Trematosphaeria pertusa]KAF2249421.1 glycoside hydrolase family 45 protein [Trematosphaeria pertusa]